MEKNKVILKNLLKKVLNLEFEKTDIKEIEIVLKTFKPCIDFEIYETE